MAPYVAITVTSGAENDYKVGMMAALDFQGLSVDYCVHDDVIKWKHFPCFWPFVRGIHRSPVNSHHKGQWRGALLFSLICAWTNGWVNNWEAGDMIRHRTHYDVTVMWRKSCIKSFNKDSRWALVLQCNATHLAVIYSGPVTHMCVSGMSHHWLNITASDSPWPAKPSMGLLHNPSWWL